MAWTRSLLKYPGGKFSLLTEIVERIPKETFDIYAEPFLGGASVALNVGRLNFRTMLLNDANFDLINFWKQVRSHPELFVETLSEIVDYRNSGDGKDVYDEVKRVFNERESSPICQAAMFYFLNKQGFNGLVRYNQKGDFNVPFGKHKGVPMPDQFDLYHVPCVFNERCHLFVMDAVTFMESLLIDEARSGKKVFVYLDPPYVPVNKTSNFTSYWKPFGIEEHERLRVVLDAMTNVGILWIMSNSKTPEVERIFDGYNFAEVSAARNISCKGDGRGKVSEYLISNFSH